LQKKVYKKLFEFYNLKAGKFSALKSISMEKKPKENDKLSVKYLGLGTQIMLSLALAVFIGIKLDKWFSFSTPLLVWILPLLILVAMIWQVIKDTSKK